MAEYLLWLSSIPDLKLQFCDSEGYSLLIYVSVYSVYPLPSNLHHVT